MLEGVIAEHVAIKHEVRLLRQLVEKSAAMNGEREKGLVPGSWVGRVDDDVRSI